MIRARELLPGAVLGIAPAVLALSLVSCASQPTRVGSASSGTDSAPGGATATSAEDGSGAATSSSSESGSQVSKVSGHILLPQGPMAIASPAFSEGGAVPARYTCDGADISPPLRWSQVPAGSAELFLFVLDESSNGPEGGIRWVVGNIDPRSDGVAAGQLPPGGIVGVNSAGRADYGGICPPDGQSHSIAVVLYALHRRFPLHSGFKPQEAERRFPQDTFASAETYASYSRP